MATSNARTRGRPRCAPLPTAAPGAAGTPAATGFATLLEVPTPPLAPTSAVAAELRLLGEACLETLLRRWAGIAPAPAALVLGEDLVAPGFPKAAAAASPSLADLSAPRSAALRASTRAAARSAAAFGVRFLESTAPLPPPAAAPPPRGGGAEVRCLPATADEERLSPLLLMAQGPQPPAAAALGFVAAPAAPPLVEAAAAFFRLPFPAKPPLIQPLRRLNESFTWYLPLRGGEAAAAIERRS